MTAVRALLVRLAVAPAVRLSAGSVGLAVWAAATAAAFYFVSAYGPTLPVQDEWGYVDVLYHATWAEKLRWAVEVHNEHRYPLGRLVWLALDAVTGHQFKAGMYASVLFQSAAGLLLLSAARRMRGRPAIEDAILPALVLHAGHVENLTMGYQVGFTLVTLAVAAFLRVAAETADRPPTARVALLAAGVAMVLACGGGLGCLLTLAVAPWAVLAGWRASRGRLAVVVAAAALLYAGWALGEGQSRRIIRIAFDLDAVRHRVTEFLTTAAGGLVSPRWRVELGWAVIGTQLAAVGGLLAAYVRKPGERLVSLGLLAALAGVWATAVAVGLSRPNGGESRYTAVACLGPAVVLLALARLPQWPARVRLIAAACFGPPAALLAVSRSHALRVAAAAAGLGLAVALLTTNWAAGKGYIEPYRMRYRSLLADLKLGLPIDVLAERRVVFPGHRGVEQFVELWAAGFPLLRDVPASPGWAVEPLPLAPGAAVPAWVPHLQPERPELVLKLDSPRRVAAVRFWLTADTEVYWHEVRLEWTRPDGTVGGETLTPWMVARRHPLTFWVEDAVTAVRLVPVSPTPGFRVVAAETLARRH